ncbi:helix-turn-helix domain-containing protein [Eubacteriales bacterium OttesenSCG-928-K08]|nr:helix-turn-helix domain-containing protein [Eubacteriales bacterium OttesenSCG-928-K08]
MPTLLRKGYSVQHAGEACGFCDYAHFIRTFKQHVGISPGKYARQRL